MRRVLFCAIAASLLVACSSTPPNSAEQTPAASKEMSTAASAPASDAAPINPLTDPSNILSKRSIYFGYNRYVVSEQYRPLIQAHAAYLREHPGANVTLEGSADTRGNSKYNLVLGRRRAEVIRKMMLASGVADSQIAIGVGKEEPQSAGHAKATLAQERRTDIRYDGE